MHDPLALGRLPGNNAYVVTPYNHNANAWPSCSRSNARPFAGKSEATIRFSEVLAHVHATPGQPTVSMMMPMMMPMMGMGIGIHSE
jgi:hypothetical protein